MKLPVVPNSTEEILSKYASERSLAVKTVSMTAQPAATNEANIVSLRTSNTLKKILVIIQAVMWITIQLVIRIASSSSPINLKSATTTSLFRPFGDHSYETLAPISAAL